MSFVIIMPTTFIVDDDSLLFRKRYLYDTSKRITNYIDGLNSLNKFLNEMNWFPDIYLLDNSCSLKNLPSELKKSILNIKNLKYIDNSANHFYGKMQKTAGIIEQYKTIINIMKNYDKIIHFEPRQELINNLFFTKARENPTKNYFKMFLRKNNSFNTGLFSIDSKLFLDYVKKNNPKEIAEKNISFEHDLFAYFIKNKFNYELIDLGLIWKREPLENMIF